MVAAMRALYGLACLVAPSIAAAQPAVSAPLGGAGPGGAAATDPWDFHQGVTFEGNLGMGYAHESLYASGDGKSSTLPDSDGALAGAVGLGGWINPQLALEARISGVQLKYTIDGITVPTTGLMVHALVGPSVQYWPTPNIWVGGGIGLSTKRLLDSTECTGDHCSRYGVGFDLRAGYAFGIGGPHTINVSVDVGRGYSPETDFVGSTDSSTITGISILVGYQYL
jgi:hypothetical protein